jgi:diguanylate cyclase (GGDEF)-like protein
MQSARISPVTNTRSENGGRQPRLLVVDDIQDNRDIIARRFRRRGFEISEAETGKQALSLIGSKQFDIVLLDVTMPDTDGIEVLDAIRRKYSPVELPVIMVTGMVQSEDILRALAAGANDYLTKPLDFAVVEARVYVQIERKFAEDKIRDLNASLSRANDQLERRVAERTEELTEANLRLHVEMERQKRSQETIRHLAHHDPLTGLANRTRLREQLYEALASARRYKRQLAVLFIDLDGFKSINDVLGHSTGDALLKVVADRLKDSVREADRLCRFGGDEFVIIQFGDEQPEGAAALAGRVIELVSRPFTVEGRELIVGASVGIVIAGEHDFEPEQLLRAADLAMYRAKLDGRGRYRFFEPGMDQQAQARRALELRLREALVTEAFDLHYQPLINLASNRITAFEALLRWEDRDLGVVSPGAFVPIAEEIGLITPIGEWVLKRACLEAASWPDDISVAVNLSPAQFKGEHLVETVKRALAESRLPPNRLELEVTESVLLEKADESLAILNELRSQGIRISLDDFGTGYSSLSYLRNFVFDKIKIDQSFIGDLSDNNGGGLAILRAVSGLGRSFGAATTAEGIETEDQLNRVRAEGCTEVQGYLFSSPRPPSEVRSLIDAQFVEAALTPPKVAKYA